MNLFFAAELLNNLHVFYSKILLIIIRWHFYQPVNFEANMLEADEKRHYLRMNLNCDLTYKQVDSDRVYHGRCTSLSGAGLSFVSEIPFEAGKGLEIHLLPKNAMTQPMTAFVEALRCTELKKGSYEIAATIKSIKGL